MGIGGIIGSCQPYVGNPTSFRETHGRFPAWYKYPPLIDLVFMDDETTTNKLDLNIDFFDIDGDVLHFQYKIINWITWVWIIQYEVFTELRVQVWIIKKISMKW